MCVNFDDKKKQIYRNEDNKRNKEKLDDSGKEQLTKCKKEGKKIMCDNLDDENMEHLNKYSCSGPLAFKNGSWRLRFS